MPFHHRPIRNEVRKNPMVPVLPNHRATRSAISPSGYGRTMFSFSRHKPMQVGRARFGDKSERKTETVCHLAPGFLCPYPKATIGYKSCRRYGRRILRKQISQPTVFVDALVTTSGTPDLTFPAVERRARHAVPLRDRGRCCRSPRPLQIPRAPLSGGGAGSGLLHQAALPKPVPLRRMPDRAPLGECVGDRVSRLRRRPPRSFSGGAISSRFL